LTEAFTPQFGHAPSARQDTAFTAIIATIVVLFCVLSIVYLSHANVVATKGYQIKQLQEEKTGLQTNLDTWNLKLTRLQALNTLSDSNIVAQMQPYHELPQFIEKETQLALNK
jgi:peptidoglycan hydrolase CwlO-like protein